MNQRGRPKKNDSRSHQYRLRLNNREWMMLHLLMWSGIDVADLLRDAIDSKIDDILNEFLQEEFAKIFGVPPQMLKGEIDHV